MTKKTKLIPVNTMTDERDTGISIEKITFPYLPPSPDHSIVDEGRFAHRHNTHTFHLLEEGSVYIDIDFQHYQMEPSSVIYIHPNQVHRTTALGRVTVVSLAITNENLNAEYLNRLEHLAPLEPLALAPEPLTLIAQAVALCLNVFKRKADPLRHSILKDSCNALIALILATYLEQTKTSHKLSRCEMITKAFREQLERNYTTVKRPAVYAQHLHLSTAYLNECVKNTTGQSVSYHIQQRIILEAKRLLSHSNQSVKEIAATLGFDDYPYFSRLFTKVTGLRALAFRAKSRD